MPPNLKLSAAIFCLHEFTQIARAGNGPSSNYCLQKNYKIKLLVQVQITSSEMAFKHPPPPSAAWLFNLALALLIENHKG